MSEQREIQWECRNAGEVPYRIFHCPFCDWHYAPGLIPSAQGEYNERKSLQHHIEYRHSWRDLIVAGQTLREENADLKRQITMLTKAVL